MRINPAVFRLGSIPKVVKTQNVKFPVMPSCCTYFTLSRNSSSLAQAPSSSQLPQGDKQYKYIISYNISPLYLGLSLLEQARALRMTDILGLTVTLLLNQTHESSSSSSSSSRMLPARHSSK